MYLFEYRNINIRIIWIELSTNYTYCPHFFTTPTNARYKEYEIRLFDKTICN